MSILHISFSLILLLIIAAGMLRIIIGPTTVDRMLAAQLFCTCGVAILLLLSKGMDSVILLDIALVFALFAALATVTFVRRTWYPGDDEDKVNGNKL